MKSNKAKAVSAVASARRRTGIISGTIIILAFVAAVIVAVYFVLDQNTSISRQNVYTMNSQLSNGIQSRLEKMEEVTTRVIQSESYKNFEESVYKGNSRNYDIRMENELKEFMLYMSTTDNYNDFFLLYDDNHTVGRVSNATNSSFENDIYSKLSGYLKDQQKLWLTGVKGDYDRLYFVRRLNSGTILAGSIFTNALKSVFPENDAKHLSFILVDDGGNEIFSVNRSSVTDEAVKNLKAVWSDGEPVAVDSLKYAASSARCANNWHIISVSDFSSRNSRYLRILIYCTSILGVAVVIVFFVGLLLSSSKMPDNIIYRGHYSTESIDKLTGLIMNEALENVIVEKIDRCINGTTMVLMLVSIKNYDLINENYGENAVDEALVKVSGVLREFYGKKNTVGKTGENEFAVLADFTDFDLFKAHDRIKDNARQLEGELDKLELENERGIIMCAVGAAIYPDDNDDYDVLYEQAKTALEDSMKTRACKCRFYKDLPKEKQGDK
ncbi:diguanylate cyclase [Ruminococcus sp. FC2018]|uniref:diguanylate cyclase domain-containing protein n=1 Tax=Ruminococcus sp. FC2018 TaxID=1410617 RepID=UPI00048D179A|nr:diguanylate cyclase [Ruminococcus sp. FC2018]